MTVGRVNAATTPMMPNVISTSARVKAVFLSEGFDWINVSLLDKYAQPTIDSCSLQFSFKITLVTDFASSPLGVFASKLRLAAFITDSASICSSNGLSGGGQSLNYY